MKTIIYVDGYNLFYGCLKHSQDKWLDIHQLLYNSVVREQEPLSELIGIKFFTADIKARVATHGQAAQQAQQAYHTALTNTYPNKIHIIKGYYSLEMARLPKYQKPPNKNDRLDVWKLEEKQTDVNIALEAYRDASKGAAKIPALRCASYGLQVLRLDPSQHGAQRNAGFCFRLKSVAGTCPHYASLYGGPG